MIQLQIPVQKNVMNDDNTITKNTENITVFIDTSFASHARWQKYFQDEYDGDTLAVYIAKSSLWLKKQEVAMAHFLDLLKVMFCFIKSDNLPDFESFLEMLDNESAPVLLQKMTIILKEAGSHVSKN